MIEKERLEEIVKEQKSFWWIQPYADSFIVREIRLPRVKVVIKEKYCVLIENDKEYLAEFEHLTEDKESAYEYAEFGNITRTERLELPTWESIEKDFDKFTNGSYVLAERDEFSLELKISKPLISQIIIYTEDDDYNWNLSRENYDDARRLCIKLFKGE